jgi:hypothetical protein
MSAEPGTKRSMIAQLELPQQIFVAQENEREGGLAGQVQSQQQAHFLQSGVSRVLGIIHKC